MKRLKGWLLISVLLLLTFALTACNEDSTNAESGVSGGSKELIIGYSGPLSGPAAYYGEDTLNGLKMAAEDINAEGGFEVDGQTYKIKLETLDDMYSPNETAANAKRLVQENDAKIIYSPHSGGIYAMQVFNELEDFIIMGYTSEPGVTEQGNTLNVRIPPRYDNYIEPFTKYEIERFGKRIAFLPTATQYGKDWADALRPVWEEHGGEIVFDESIDFSKDTDFQTILSNALSKDPDVLFIGGASEPTALVLKQARDLGFEGGFIVMDQAKVDQMAAVLDGNYDLMEGVVAVTPLVDSDFPGTAEFVEKYHEQHGKNPGSEAGFHYLSLYILTEAMKAAGTVDDTKKIMAALDEGAKNLPEAKQVYVIKGVDENGGFEQRLRMAYIEDGELHQFSTQ
ncbi:ABC transporter substrate-binding protein [Sporosarcina pasteurii]|uniref:Leu/Ile/Val-binding protein n=1 Tax=Sporosarcina pasteurii TaxID=1474 RepID=A0A380C3N3_SPOPA|nr:ABC transporter substrate-binding protein [Sporosarcina pasteurii]MDS9471574.1 ABC transporter substrate-binding protein [Sporosarcina pasteurii]QBQ04811.1 ethanolamine utilization protein EutJ [Sporosarcina pasteurii]SUJ11161.1 Leu/Ile/Val-binding protein precursor [Sporosarcina pasteurii]